jgi:hypothetical protein
LQLILGYLRWENFYKVISKAKKACYTAGSGIDDHFRDRLMNLPASPATKFKKCCGIKIIIFNP